MEPINRLCLFSAVMCNNIPGCRCDGTYLGCEGVLKVYVNRSAIIRAWKCDFPTLFGIMTGQPNYQQTDIRIDSEVTLPKYSASSQFQNIKNPDHIYSLSSLLSNIPLSSQSSMITPLPPTICGKKKLVKGGVFWMADQGPVAVAAGVNHPARMLRKLCVSAVLCVLLCVSLLCLWVCCVCAQVRSSRINGVYTHTHNN